MRRFLISSLFISGLAISGTVVRLEGKILSYNDKEVLLLSKQKKVKVKRQLLPSMVQSSPEKYIGKEVEILLRPSDYDELKL